MPAAIHFNLFGVCALCVMPCYDRHVIIYSRLSLCVCLLFTLLKKYLTELYVIWWDDWSWTQVFGSNWVKDKGQGHRNDKK